MAIFEVLITDVTRYRDSYCIAGWDINRKKMIRPEPPSARADSEPSKFWPQDHAGKGQILCVGNLVRIEAKKPEPHFGFPHATEDRIAQDPGALVMLKTVTHAELMKETRGSVAVNLNAAFGGGLQRRNNGKAYVEANFEGPSLGAVEVGPKAVHLHTDTNWNGKTQLRVLVNDGANHYDLSAPAAGLRDRWQEIGLEKLRKELTACSTIHLRVGLARAWGDNPCYAQVNGLYMR